jgi:MYXO-CTERM domain-containing protein
MIGRRLCGATVSRVILALATLAPGCVDTEAPDDPLGFRSDVEGLPPPVQKVAAPLPAAHCDITVDGVGVLSMEDEYLPRVIRCENGGANLEALKAQAIAARSVAYYAIETAGSICDSQGCQVYGCAGDPEPIHYQAVMETSGVYMMNNGTLTYGFYVAGDNGVSPPACVGDVSVGTEHWVTYNEGKSGTEVVQTELGFVFDPGDAGYGQNRGCMSQWGARCLENNNAYDFVDIMRFYYGEDIQLVQADGECVTGSFDTGAVDTGVDYGAVDTGDGGLDSGGPGGDVDTSAGPGGDVDTGVGEDVVEDGGPEDAGDAASEDDAGPGVGATGIDGALPDSFGGAASPPGGCACTTDAGGRAGWTLPLLVLVPLALRRRRLA